MSKKSWKDYLLSSGMPLEYSVIQTLEKLGIRVPREYKYERINETGVPTLFSIDVHATEIDALRNLWLELFIECKYRHEGTRWVFTPEEYHEFFRPTFRDTFVIIDALETNRQVDVDLLNQFSGRYLLCGKGVELLAQDANPKSIEQCVQQLRFGLVDKVIDCIIHQADGLLGRPTPVFVLVPIIVTTAELWRLRSGVSIEDIRNAEELEEIAELKDLLIIHRDPDNQLKRHTQNAFTTCLTAQHKERLDEALKKIGSPGYHNYVDFFSSYYPSLFVTIHYHRFEAAMANLLSFFKKAEIVKSRERPR